MTAPAITNTRGALRLATLEAVRAELTGLATPIEGGPLDGIEVVSIGSVTEALERVKASPLPPIDVGSAEVKTPADVFVDAICPECNLPTRILIQLTSVLETTREAGSTIKLKAKAKGKAHVHHQLALEVDADQEELGLDAAGDIVEDDNELLPGPGILVTAEEAAGLLADHDDVDLRPTGEVNADALRGAVEDDLLPD